MMADFTPLMMTALRTCGRGSFCSCDVKVGAAALIRLVELGFLEVETPAESYFPAAYRLTEKGKGAQAVLNYTPPFKGREGPVAAIQVRTAAYFGIPVDEMFSARRSRLVARPRQVAMYLAKKLTPKSLPDIGRRFGGRDHTTVIHAVKKVEQLMADDLVFRHKVTTLTSIILSTREPEKPQTETLPHRLLEAA